MGIHWEWWGNLCLFKCVSIVKEFFLKNDIKGACEFLVKESSTRWLKVTISYVGRRSDRWYYNNNVVLWLKLYKKKYFIK